MKKPSKEMCSYWIPARPSKQLNNNLDKSKFGKWLIFVPVKDIDKSWEQIKIATEQNLLGFSSQSSTELGWYENKKPPHYVICIHTYDYDDVNDVKRVREELKRMGFVKPLKYKTDKATLQGVEEYLYEY